MTEPIAVDMPAKPSFSRSGPGLAPGLPSVPTPAPTPKVEVAPKPAPLASTAATVAAVAASAVTGVPPAALTPAPAAAAGFLARFTRKQLTLGAAALSLFAGIGAVRMMFPAKDDAKTATSANDKVALSQPPAPTKAPAIEVVPPRTEPVSALPPLPLMPDKPVGGPPAAKITGFSPVPPPTVTDPRYPTTPPIPDFTVPPPPPPVGVVPISGYEAPKLPAPPTGGTPPVPTFPPAPPTGPPALPAVPVLPVDPRLPAPPSGLPGVPPPSGDLFPPAPPIKPVAPPIGVAPPVVLPDPAKPLFPALPDPTKPQPGSFEPKLPSLPDFKPVGVAPPVGPPSVFPVDVSPKTDVKPPPPSFDPPIPGGFGSTPTGVPAGFTKPAGASEVKPIVPEFAPKTTFDVDLHNPKDSDTYETISLEFYNDKRFAAALKAFNQNAALQGGRYVNVPPIHVLKRQFPAQTGGAVIPVSGSGIAPPPPSAAPEWGAAPKPALRNTFTVPQGGMTLRQVARQALGNEQRWGEIYDLNPQVTKPSDLLPAGTELKLPWSSPRIVDSF